ncbi:MAG: DUF805 domain-containing protein [Candidatus Eisenbacteria bacterium]
MVGFMYGSLWVWLTLMVRRCHDRGRSGWFLLLKFVPFAGIWVLLEICALGGTVGPNKYGPDPTT